jgi:hypothetical protein
MPALNWHFFGTDRQKNGRVRRCTSGAGATQEMEMDLAQVSVGTSVTFTEHVMPTSAHGVWHSDWNSAHTRWRRLRYASPMTQMITGGYTVSVRRRRGSPMCCAGSTITRHLSSPTSGTGRAGLPNWRHEPGRKQRCLRQFPSDRHRPHRTARQRPLDLASGRGADLDHPQGPDRQAAIWSTLGRGLGN